MLSFKFYHALAKPNFNIIQSYRIFANKQILKGSRQFNRFSKSPKSSNVVKIAVFGLVGSVFTYASCAVWEYENIRSNISRRSFFKTQFANLFGRPLYSSDIFWVILAINVTIFAMFRLSHNFNHILTKFPLNSQSRPPALFLSMFTHMEPFHLLINMYVLHTFSPLINHFGAPHFTAVYIVGGMVSGLASVMYKSSKVIMTPSVGASGAILSILGMFASMNPELRFGIPIISDVFNFSFSAKTAIGMLLAMDVCGLVFFKKSRLDHVCHISAVLFGVFYGVAGRNLFWESRRTWMAWYYKLRST